MKSLILFAVLALSCQFIYATEIGKPTLSGYMRDKANGEALIGATIYIEELKTGTVSNVYGFYSISLPNGKYTVVFSYIGFTSVTKTIDLNQDVKLNLELETGQKMINEITITDTKETAHINNTEMSTVKLEARTIKSIPALMGEVDVLKAIQLLPGVQSSGEGSSGFNVRGGSSDQNLILLDEATVYNASHLMGFFSVFNNDAIKDVKLYKGDIPAEYGGRLASLLDIRMKEGNNKKFEVNGGIGTISSRLTVEGPIVKDKCSFTLSGRRSYADVFLPLARNKDVRENTLYFYDLNMKLNYKLNENNRVFISSYLGRDVFAFGKTDPFRIDWGNKTNTLRWNHLFSDRLFSNFSLIYSDYDYYLGQKAAVSGFKWTSNMKDLKFKADFGYYLNPKNTIRFGLSSTYHHFHPGKVEGLGDNTAFNTVETPGSTALEHALFLSNEQKLTPLLSVEYGLRFSAFQNIGKATVYNFDESFNSIDSSVYAKGNIFNTYSGLEPRISAKYNLSEISSVKASYSRTRQYIHLASSTNGGSPLDIWLPSGKLIKPQICDQVALGYFRNIYHNKIETSVEVYYKDMQNQIDFKDHATLMLNQKIEGELRFGTARAYGAEFLIRKNSGKLTGWISYTLSRTMRKIPDINNGKEYPASYDRPHNISVVANYELSKRLSISANWVFTSGTPVTFPTGRFTYGNMVLPVYSDRNSYRLPSYHRLDIGITLKGKEKEGKKFFGEWNFSVYNAYYRKNTYMIQFQQNEDNPEITEAYKVYLFPFIPAITYNFHF